MIYSPLRYPGGKAKLAPFMGLMIDKINLANADRKSTRLNSSHSV